MQRGVAEPLEACRGMLARNREAPIQSRGACSLTQQMRSSCPAASSWSLQQEQQQVQQQCPQHPEPSDKTQHEGWTRQDKRHICSSQPG